MDLNELTTRWPYMFIVDQQQRSQPWVVLHAPIQTLSRKTLFAQYRHAGLRFIGMSSFMEYPSATQTDPLDYASVCEGWCHCFKQPERYLPADSPSVLLSLSDFVDPQTLSPASTACADVDLPKFDFVYIGASEPWKMAAKNWPLAQACIKALCEKLHLRGLIIGVSPALVAPSPQLTVWPWLPQEQFLQILGRTKLLLVTSELDASPRVLTEALCLDVPLLVYEKIIGGWKYVSADSGRHFSNHEDIIGAARQCLDASLAPRKWYIHYRKLQPAGAILSNLLQQIDPAFEVNDGLRLSYSASVSPDTLRKYSQPSAARHA